MQRYLPDIEVLAADPEFVAWVRTGQVSEDNAWSQLALGDDEQRARLQEAVAFVNDLNFAPRPVAQQQVDTDWQRLVRRQAEATAPVRPLHLRPRPKKWLAVAATILLLLTAGLGWAYLNNGADYRTDFAERAAVTLDDGTVIDLQANSRLYIDEWTPQERTVRLEGEAFFNVARATNRPFTVRAGKTNVTVLGTRFNVLNRDDTPTVALEEGSVSLQSPTSKTTLTPGEIATVSTDGDIRQEASKDLRQYTSWREGRWVLEEVSLRDLAERITTNFGVKVIFKDPGFADKQLSGSLPADELAELANTLSRLLDRPVTATGNTFIFE